MDGETTAAPRHCTIDVCGAAEICVAVVGFGPRGLSIFERLTRLAEEQAARARRIRIEIVDPSCTGTGLHTTDQPDYLLLNTPCAQVSMFPDPHTVTDRTDRLGPTLYQWATARGLRLGADGCSVGRTGRRLRPTDFLPRRVLGEYLKWFGQQMEARLPDHVRVVKRRTQVADMDLQADGARLTLADGTWLRADYVFLTIGHAPNAAADRGRPGAERLIDPPLPLADRMARIGARQSVAVGGFGLTAMDIVSALTRGRGGRYVHDGGRLRYRPSGGEPAIVMYSRTGVPYRARPLVCRFDRIHRPLVLTGTRIVALRARRGGRLDFARDILPLILTELRIAYRQCQAERRGDRDARDLTARLSAGDMDALLDALDDELGVFDPEAALDGAAGMALRDQDAYRAWLCACLAADLAEARLGTSHSPVKAALDILRQLRDTVRSIVDFGGLTDPSLDQFYRRMVPLMNRAVVGPQYERHEELLALMAAGLVDTPLGPSPDCSWDAGAGCWMLASTALDKPCWRPVDWLCPAAVAPPAVDGSASPLVQAMYHKGSIRRHVADSRLVRGIDVDPDLHPLDRGGMANKRVWVLGPLCEGAAFYNHLVPSPGVWSRPIADAHRCVRAMYDDAAMAGTRGPRERSAMARRDDGWR